MAERILVIKLSALGDFIQAFGPFQAIRRHHPNAHVTLLTTRPFAEMARRSPWFDEVWSDERPKGWQVLKMLRLRARLRGGSFDRVYDLQTNDRSALYYRLMKPVDWSGHVPGASLAHDTPQRNAMHTVDRQAEQLRIAGIPEVPQPDLSWLDADISGFGLPEPFVLLAPGGAPHRPEKRWPGRAYAVLACRLASKGVTPVILGTAAEAGEAEEISRTCPQAVSLIGRTSLFDIAALARRAAGAVGNDTGPMHLIAKTGCPSVAVFSHASDPALCAQRGPRVAILRREDLSDLEPEAVETALDLVAAQRSA